MSKLVVIVDCQNDFIDGALGTPEARAMIPRLVEKIKTENENTSFIFTADTHGEDYMNTSEGKNLPVSHCIHSTPGWEIPTCLTECFENSPVVIKKPTFGSYKLMEFINDYLYTYPEITTIEFVGICTDICVVSNVLMAKAAFYDKYEIVVDAKCCAGSTPERHKAALDTMKSCQINVINE